jgi:hypothetical protein
MADTFICEECGGEFEKGWSEEEAEAEAKRKFPAMDLSNADTSDPMSPAVVCENCFQAIERRMDPDRAMAQLLLQIYGRLGR